ncbi:uncharacterized protein LOC142320194 [Lycorma delicatula]|uniref:uncharacterized protein LOC142320194 n=1 Tax=Lycorma delicatula TaxID=130591 RepID=UPI003F510410
MAKIIIVLSMALIAVAEPPVGRYLPAQQTSVGFPSSTYGAPSTSFGSGFGVARPSSSYGTPSVNIPSSSYGTPSGSYGAPSSSYGAPGGGYYKGDDQSEPANYAFQYDVLAPEYNVEFGHQESRKYESAQGVYYVLLPDGRKQKVEYTADENGYKPVVSYTGGYAGGVGGGYAGGVGGGYAGGVGGGYAGGVGGGYAGGVGGGYTGRVGGYSGSAVGGGYSGGRGGSFSRPSSSYGLPQSSGYHY